MLSINLNNLVFFGYHGLYEEEKILGNEYELNIAIKHAPQRLPVEKLEDTVDYTAVYELVKQRMAVPTPLLETLATSIATEILDVFTLADEVFVSIRKMHPPVSKINGNLGVTFTLKRGEKLGK